MQKTHQVPIISAETTARYTLCRQIRVPMTTSAACRPRLRSSPRPTPTNRPSKAMYVATAHMARGWPAKVDQSEVCTRSQLSLSPKLQLL